MRIRETREALKDGVKHPDSVKHFYSSGFEIKATDTMPRPWCPRHGGGGGGQDGKIGNRNHASRANQRLTKNVLRSITHSERNKTGSNFLPDQIQIQVSDLADSAPFIAVCRLIAYSVKKSLKLTGPATER